MKPIVDIAPLATPSVKFGCACGGTFSLGFELLITGQAASCDMCEATMRVDLGASQESMDRLKAAVAKLAEVRRAVS